MRGYRWLAAVAAMALIAGPAAQADATTRAKVAVKAKAKPRKKVARRAPARPAVRTVAPVSASPAPVQAPAVPVAAYRWLDDAAVMMDAIGDGAPDFAFDRAGATNYAWQLADGATIVAEPMPQGDTRFFFFEPDMTAPFLVRDRLYSFGFERGVLAAVYDAQGSLAPHASGDWLEQLAGQLYAEGKGLWFAARTPRPPAPGSYAALTATVVADFDRWQDGGGWRDYRRGPGFDRWRDRAQHYRAERDARLARGTARRWPRDANAGGGERRPWGPQPGYARPATGRDGAPGRERTPGSGTTAWPTRDRDGWQRRSQDDGSRASQERQARPGAVEPPQAWRAPTAAAPQPGTPQPGTPQPGTPQPGPRGRPDRDGSRRPPTAPAAAPVAPALPSPPLPAPPTSEATPAPAAPREGSGGERRPDRPRRPEPPAEAAPPRAPDPISAAPAPAVPEPAAARPASPPPEPPPAPPPAPPVAAEPPARAAPPPEPAPAPPPAPAPREPDPTPRADDTAPQ